MVKVALHLEVRGEIESHYLFVLKSTAELLMHGLFAYGEQAVDTEFVQEHGLRPDHVRYGNHRETQPIRLSGFRVRAGRSGAALAATNHICTDHEVAIRIECAAGAYHVVPPPRPRISMVVSRSVSISRESMLYEDSIGPVLIELAVCLVRDSKRGEFHSRVQ